MGQKHDYSLLLNRSSEEIRVWALRGLQSLKEKREFILISAQLFGSKFPPLCRDGFLRVFYNNHKKQTA